MGWKQSLAGHTGVTGEGFTSRACGRAKSLFHKWELELLPVSPPLSNVSGQCRQRGGSGKDSLGKSTEKAGSREKLGLYFIHTHTVE